MSLYFTLTRRKICFISLTFIIICMVSAEFFHIYAYEIDGSSAKARADFAKEIGCDINDKENYSSRTITIPQEFSKLYDGYNKLQLEAGFDLSSYKGCKVLVYTYPSVKYDGLNGETQLNLLVYRGRVIGGDISETSIGGKMLPLYFE